MMGPGTKSQSSPCFIPAAQRENPYFGKTAQRLWRQGLPPTEGGQQPLVGKTGVMTDWLPSPRMRQEAEESKSAELRLYQLLLGSLSEWSRDSKGLRCQLPPSRSQEEGAEKQVVWLVLVSEDTSF